MGYCLVNICDYNVSFVIVVTITSCQLNARGKYNIWKLAELINISYLI